MLDAGSAVHESLKERKERFGGSLYSRTLDPKTESKESSAFYWSSGLSNLSSNRKLNQRKTGTGKRQEKDSRSSL